MKLLLVNTNRYRTPPVPPIALEYLASAVRLAGHECRVLDLCFSDNIQHDIAGMIDEYKPDCAGITIRNIDTVLFDNNVFFLDTVREMTGYIKDAGVPVVAGGVGYSFLPEDILAYIGADWGVKGPGERALVSLLDSFPSPPPRGTVLDGYAYGFDPDMPVRRGEDIDYSRYISEGGIAGFQTQKGCREHCSYCGEGIGKVSFRNPERIAGELRSLTGKGIGEFHLCDTEFNQDLDFCKAFLTTLIDKGPAISWALYMKERPFDTELFRLIKISGATLVTVSVPTGSGSPDDLPRLISQAKDAGLQVAVDLLVGLPGETDDSIARTIDRFRHMSPGPDTVGVNSTLRLYQNCAITAKVTEADEYRPYLFGELENNPGFLRPAFYRRYTADMLKTIIGDDPLFKIEGFERTSNYQRLKNA